ncbi:hypothetical protein [Paraburkholderia heleia]|uniref:hypothetical protein n=1 Tax=Paraburkholderia heleia TaxID=634127 RepID=UPI002AB6BB33|nr:hypothetical protein [Paraburkholderia heleia]
MAERTLHEVLADVIDAGHRYPALQAQILHCLFDESGLRGGLFDMDCMADPRDAGGGKLLTVLTARLWPTEWLLQFARAVSCGVMPEAVLPTADDSDGHEISRTREEHETTLTTGAFMRIPEYLNTE